MTIILPPKRQPPEAWLDYADHTEDSMALWQTIKTWPKRHAAIAGAVVGGLVGIPGGPIGIVAGIAMGAGAGNTIGSDERAAKAAEADQQEK
jgi:hypothetical protein